jgi:hypothetical protein
VGQHQGSRWVGGEGVFGQPGAQRGLGGFKWHWVLAGQHQLITQPKEVTERAHMDTS